MKGRGRVLCWPRLGDLHHLLQSSGIVLALTRTFPSLDKFWEPPTLRMKFWRATALLGTYRKTIPEWKIRSCVPNHLRRSSLLLHRDWALAQRWSATGGTQEPDVEFQFPKDAVQRVAVHAQCLSSPTLIRFLLSQNGKNEDLLEFAYRLGIPGAAPVHVQHQFLELFLHSELPSALPGRV